MTTAVSENRLIPSELDTRHLPPCDAFDAWRESMVQVIDVSPADESGPLPFTGYNQAYDLGPLIFAESTAHGSCTWRNPPAARAAGADPFLVQLKCRGESVGVNGGREMRLGPGDLHIIDLGRPYRCIDTGYRCLTLVVPRETLVPRFPRGARLNGLILPRNGALSRILGSHLEAAWGSLPEIGPEEASVVAEGLLGAVANAFSLACGGDPGPTPEPRAPLEALCAHIETHLREPRLGVASLCRDFHCSRSHLYRLFEPYGGVAAYIRERRLAHCYHQLGTPGGRRQRIAEVAHHWGFADQSHFSRLFREAFGMTPRQVQQAPAGTAPLVAEEPASQLPHYAGWLRRLLEQG